MVLFSYLISFLFTLLVHVRETICTFSKVLTKLFGLQMHCSHVLVNCTSWIESWNKLTWTAKNCLAFLGKKKKKKHNTPFRSIVVNTHKLQNTYFCFWTCSYARDPNSDLYLQFSLLPRHLPHLLHHRHHHLRPHLPFPSPPSLPAEKHKPKHILQKPTNLTTKQQKVMNKLCIFFLIGIVTSSLASSSSFTSDREFSDSSLPSSCIPTHCKSVSHNKPLNIIYVR